MECNKQSTIPVLSNEGSRYRFQKGHRSQRKKVSTVNVAPVVLTSEIVPVIPEAGPAKDYLKQHFWIEGLDEISDGSLADDRHSVNTWDDISDSPFVDSDDGKLFQVIDQDRESSHDEKENYAEEFLHAFVHRCSRLQYLRYKDKFFRPKVFQYQYRDALCTFQIPELRKVEDEVVGVSASVGCINDTTFKMGSDDAPRNQAFYQGKAHIQQMLDKTDCPLLDFQGKADIQQMLDKIDCPLLGLGYIVEIWHKSNTEVRCYYCMLCRETLMKCGVKKHAMGRRHRVKFIKTNYPSFVKNESDLDSDVWNITQKNLDKISNEIERACGRQQVFITNHNYYLKNVKKISNAIAYYQEQEKSSNLENMKLPSTDNKDEKVRLLEDVIFIPFQERVGQGIQKGNCPSSGASSDLLGKGEINNQQSSGVEKENKLRKEFYQGKSGIQDMIDEMKSSLMGLGYILEIWNDQMSEVQNYRCFLCSESFTKHFFCKHILQFAHRKKYLEKHYPQKVLDFSKTPFCTWKKHKKNVFEELCKSIEKERGRQELFIAVEYYYVKNFKMIERTILHCEDAYDEKKSMCNEENKKFSEPLLPVKDKIQNAAEELHSTNIKKILSPGCSNKDKSSSNYHKIFLSKSNMKTNEINSDKVRDVSPVNVSNKKIKQSNYMKNIMKRKNTHSPSSLTIDESCKCNFNSSEHSSQRKKYLSPSTEISKLRKQASPTVYTSKMEDYKTLVNIDKPRTPLTKYSESGNRQLTKPSGSTERNSRYMSSEHDFWKNSLSRLNLESKRYASKEDSWDSPRSCKSSKEREGKNYMAKESAFVKSFSRTSDKKICSTYNRRTSKMKSSDSTLCKRYDRRSVKRKNSLSPRRKSRNLSPRTRTRNYLSPRRSPVYRTDKRKTRDSSVERSYGRKRFVETKKKSCRRVLSRSNSPSSSVSVGRRDRYRLSHSRSPVSIVTIQKSRMEEAELRRYKKSSGNTQKKCISRSSSCASRSPSYLSHSPSRRKREWRGRSSSSDSSWFSPERRRRSLPRQSPFSHDRDSSSSPSRNRRTSSTDHESEDSFKNIHHHIQRARTRKKEATIADFLHTIKSAEKRKPAKEGSSSYFNTMLRNYHGQENYPICMAPNANSDVTDGQIYAHGNLSKCLQNSVQTEKSCVFPVRNQDMSHLSTLTDTCAEKNSPEKNYFEQQIAIYSRQPSISLQNSFSCEETQLCRESQILSETTSASCVTYENLVAHTESSMPYNTDSDFMCSVQYNKHDINKGTNVSILPRTDVFCNRYNAQVPETGHSNDITRPPLPSHEIDETLFQKMRQTVSELFGTSGVDNSEISTHTSANDLQGTDVNLKTDKSSYTNFSSTMENESNGNKFSSCSSWKAISNEVSIADNNNKKTNSWKLNAGDSQQLCMEPGFDEVNEKSLKSSRKSYHLAQDPENYEKEWKKFYKQRASELLKEGKDPSTYDFSKDWGIYLKNFSEQHLYDYQTKVENSATATPNAKHSDGGKNISNIRFIDPRLILTASSKCSPFTGNNFQKHQNTLSGSNTYPPSDGNFPSFSKPEMQKSVEPKTVTADWKLSPSLQKQSMFQASIGGSDQDIFGKNSGSAVVTADSLEHDMLSKRNNNQQINLRRAHLAYRLSNVLTNLGMIDIPGSLLSDMLTRIGAYSESPMDISESEILSILRNCGYAI